MPGRAPAETRLFSSEETLRLLRETGISQFQLRLYRYAQGFQSFVARFANASVQHFEDPSWVLELCGGGSYAMSAHHESNTYAEETGWPMVGGYIHFAYSESVRDVDLNAPQQKSWRGPSMMVFPRQSDTVDATPARQRWPKLKEPVRHLTLGYNPDVGTLMMDGKAGSLPSHLGSGFFERMYLMGEPQQSGTEWRTWNSRFDFSFGIGPNETRGSMPGVVVRVSGKTVFHCSFEVVKACSKGHLDASVLEAHARMLAKLNARRDTVAEQLEDAMVRLYQSLEQLKDMPLVGYQLNPVIKFDRNDDIRIDGVPSGMRLYLTGLVEDGNV